MRVGIQISARAVVFHPLPAIQKIGLIGANGLAFVVILRAATYRPAVAGLRHFSNQRSIARALPGLARFKANRGLQFTTEAIAEDHRLADLLFPAAFPSIITIGCQHQHMGGLLLEATAPWA